MAPPLFNLGIGPGYSLESFGGGHRNDPLQPPIVDLVVPPGTRQEAVLKRPPEPGKPYVISGVVPSGESPKPPDPGPASR